MRFFRLNYFQKIILGFAALILFGAFLLMLPISSNERVYTPFLNALFTSTSASCVTGLIVYDTAVHWSFFGQVVILILIQIGGLGVASSFYPEKESDILKEILWPIPFP